MNSYKLNLTKLPIWSFMRTGGIFYFIFSLPYIVILKIFRISKEPDLVFFDELEFYPYYSEKPSELAARENEYLRSGFKTLGYYDIKGHPYPCKCCLMLFDKDTVCAVTSLTAGKKNITSSEIITFGKSGISVTDTNAKPGLLNNYPADVKIIRIPDNLTCDAMLEQHIKNARKFINDTDAVYINNAEMAIQKYKEVHNKVIKFWVKKGYLKKD